MATLKNTGTVIDLAARRSAKLAYAQEAARKAAVKPFWTPPMNPASLVLTPAVKKIFSQRLSKAFATGLSAADVMDRNEGDALLNPPLILGIA